MKNLVEIYRTLRNPSEGADWYVVGHEFCKKLAEKYRLELPVVCAIVSILSPATNWEQNKKDAVRLIQSVERGVVRIDRLRLTTYGHNVRKAMKVLRGKIQPGDAFSIVSSPKTLNFFLNLLNPHDPSPVTIDRHAYVIATGEKTDKIHKALYLRIASAYKQAAEEIGILPSQLQAVLWVNHRKENRIEFEEYQF